MNFREQQYIIRGHLSVNQREIPAYGIKIVSWKELRTYAAQIQRQSYIKIVRARLNLARSLNSFERSVCSNNVAH